jgi:hypothetical protein
MSVVALRHARNPIWIAGAAAAIGWLAAWFAAAPIAKRLARPGCVPSADDIAAWLGEVPTGSTRPTLGRRLTVMSSDLVPFLALASGAGPLAGLNVTLQRPAGPDHGRERRASRCGMARPSKITDPAEARR